MLTGSAAHEFYFFFSISRSFQVKGSLSRHTFLVMANQHAG